MAITCPRCGADFDATLFEFGHRVRCSCGAEVEYPGADLRGGHVLAGSSPPERGPSAVADIPKAIVETRRPSIILWIIISTALVEAVTLYLRFRSGITATGFNETAPLVLQIDHMFWSVPLLVVVWLVWRNVRLSGALLGIALGLVLSDLLHHFVVLPLIVGNTGWHWP